MFIPVCRRVFYERSTCYCSNRTIGVIERSVAAVWIAISCANKPKIRLVVAACSGDAIVAVVEPGMHKAFSADSLQLSSDERRGYLLQHPHAGRPIE